MPTFVPRTNLPTREPFRWSLWVARKELGISPTTLKGRLSDANEGPGPDGCYSTKQLLAAAFGSLHRARLSQIKEETQHTGLKNQILRSEYLNRAALEDVFGRCAISIKQIIENSALTRSEKDDLLHSLAAVREGISSVAAGSKRTGNGSGDHPAKRKRGRPRKTR